MSNIFIEKRSPSTKMNSGNNIKITFVDKEKTPLGVTKHFPPASKE